MTTRSNDHGWCTDTFQMNDWTNYVCKTSVHLIVVLQNMLWSKFHRQHASCVLYNHISASPFPSLSYYFYLDGVLAKVVIILTLSRCNLAASSNYREYMCMVYDDCTNYVYIQQNICTSHSGSSKPASCFSYNHTPTPPCIARPFI